MKYKKIMILLVLAVFLLGIAGVSASEIDNVIASEDTDSMELSADNDMAEDNLQTHEENEELTLTDNDDTLSVKNDTEILGANTGTYSGLSTEIGSGGNIELQHNYYTYDTGDTISISVADSVIDGKGAVIDMIGSNICAFHVSASGVTIKNITIKNAKYAGSGGAILFTSSATSGTVTNCNFTNNTATNDGGAVYFSSDGEVTKCSFANNTAKMGNAIYINSNHGTISDCDFTNNLLTKGAIHSVTGDITFSNNILDVNDVVLCRNFTEIQKLIDRANDGDEITIDGLYAGFGIPIRITKSLTLIGQNNATLDAKKLSKILYITANNVIIKNIQFTNGYAENEGAVYFYSAGSVENCNFTNNEVTGEKSSGGAIYFNGAGNVINSIFTANRATRNGGAIYVEAQSINNNFSSQFYNNYAGQSGGAIFFHNLVQNNNFLCIFKDNYAGYGGGIFFSKNANANRFSSDFINNTAKSCGGAMFFYSTTDKNNFTGCFINNSALGQIDPANGNGGAITFKNVSTNSIFTCDFSNNTASLNGGGVNYRETPKNIIFNANFINNSAQRGGGVNFFNTFEDVIFNGEFIGNSAENGGALAAGYGTIGDISFKNNHANNGGAVYLAGSGSTVNCNFTNNRATHNGGAVYISEKCNVVNCSFADNSAAHDGGAVYSKFGAVENCNFTGNNASNDGGAVSLSYPSNVANCHFADNSAKNGGALYFLNDDDNVINCSFVANEATSRGGAVFFMTPRQVNATNCYFEGNSAPEGGAIFCYTWAVTADSVILKTDSDTTNNTIILSPKLNVYDFYSVYGSCENLTFNLTTRGGMPITNGNISMIIYFKDNDRGAVNYTCLSGKDWTVDLPVGSYYAFINTEYKEFEPIIRTIEITMPNVQFYINVTSVTTNSKTMNITAKSNIPKNLIWDGKLLFILSNGTQIDATYGANGTWWAEHTFDDYGEYKINATYVGLDNVTVNNGTITINNINSTITLDNIVLDYGESENVTVTTTGATGIKANINGTDVTVINNFTIQISGLKAGNHTLSVTTIPDENHNPVTVTSKITVNKVESTLTVGDIVFDYDGEGSGDVSFTGASEVTANVINQPKAVVSVSGNKIFVSGLAAGTYTLNVTTVPDENHTAVTETSTITVNKINSTLTLDGVVLDYGENKNITVTTEGS
ncbi:right-handed parallel beta-helix repeat-containing protein, partial [uncultured Methanobrevibacter sp.]|uniref:right-handed parallel beta-helix repeat-containing protein n=1 Tax=uncultured Methanobrevibacter sp. TaxID=253161 RepID=UPI0025F8E302